MTEFKEINSRENSLIKFTSELQRSSKKRQETGLFALEGLRICKDASENGIRFDKLIVSKSAIQKYNSEITDFIAISDECYVLTDNLFKKVSETCSPQGIIAIAKKPKNHLVDFKKGRFIALENIQDPSNLGAIARSCEALGASGIIMSKGCCDPYSSKSLRASMGTLLRIPLFFVDDFISNIKDFGLKTFACIVDGNAIPITDVNFCDGCVVLIGNEANGLSDITKSNSDYLVTVPMKGKAESLNASVAAAIATWEMMK